MPELPEVETTRRGIAAHLEGKKIEAVIVRKKHLRWQIPDILTTILPGQQVQHIHRRGKYLLLECATGHVLIHLGMSGSLRVLLSDTPSKKHDHLDIVFTHGLCLRYHDQRRCVLWTDEPIHRHPLLVNLGPEPFSAAFTGEHLHRHAIGRRVAVKNDIMNAHTVAGIGNIYANEALFLAEIHPASEAGNISLVRYQRLAETIKQILSAAIEMGGTTLRDFTRSDGNPGYFKQSLRVYGRVGKACVQCGNTIELQKIGQRASYYCPVCQH
ncbi:MAG: DNA-formamidopyrimidine glycosylase [Candidatus Parabeggiatoa sp. nov. 2]|nr:MAG: DNA-formamidopyrimidine glycosylase [Beggiatoa sp. 4572_84]RKZ57816.1 MAG: DNA-formamidopyrimidine glycosylase [Gammaproteobacteria bacterium]